MEQIKWIKEETKTNDQSNSVNGVASDERGNDNDANKDTSLSQSPW